VRDDGDADSTVLLLQAADISPNVRWLDQVRWGQDDTFVSIPALASLADGSDDPSDFHMLYVAGIVFDESGAPSVATPPLAVLDGVIQGVRDVAWHDWSPDGTRVAYTLWNPNVGYALRIADLLTGQTRLLAEGGGEPAWSPDGSRIAFRYVYGSGIYLIRPDGTGQQRLTNSGIAAIWSPDGRFLAYSNPSGRNSTYDVFRIPAAGGSAVSLTKDLDGDSWMQPGFGWR
jgi:dipeptidyl aminopeptidase/acylaminoacyl peptidase